MTDVRILADDLTGALDSAAAFAGDVPVYFDAPEPRDARAHPVAAVATATRDVALASLPARLRAALPWLADADVAVKKVDSLLRGNTYAETAWVARAGGFRHVVFAPAFPQQGRVTCDGRHWVIPPGASDAARSEAGGGPPADAFAVFGLHVGSPADGRPGAPTVSIPDVCTDADLDRVVAAAGSDARAWLWCGSAGLAHALAAAHRLRPTHAAAMEAGTRGGPVLLVTGSRHPVLRAQWARVQAAMPAAAAVDRGNLTMLRAALRALADGAAFARLDLAPNRVLDPRDADALLARQADAIVARAPRPRALLVVGGDSLRALCRAAGARALLARASARPGWGHARLVGGAWDGVACHSRSGAFGAPDDLTTMVRAIAGASRNSRTKGSR